LNITDGGLDGIGIGDFGKITEWELQFKPFEIGSNNNVGITHFGIDGYGRKKIKVLYKSVWVAQFGLIKEKSSLPVKT